MILIKQVAFERRPSAQRCGVTTGLVTSSSTEMLNTFTSSAANWKPTSSRGRDSGDRARSTCWANNTRITFKIHPWRISWPWQSFEIRKQPRKLRREVYEWEYIFMLNNMPQHNNFYLGYHPSTSSSDWTSPRPWRDWAVAIVYEG